MKANKIKEFWECFNAQAELLSLQQDAMSNSAKQNLEGALAAVDPDLVVEIRLEDDAPELIISANGVRDLVDLADQVIAEAPTKDGVNDWRILALRPAKIARLHAKSEQAFPGGVKNMRCSLSQELRRIDITVYLEDYDSVNYYSYLDDVFHFLDLALGERIVAKQVGEICLRSSKEASASDSFPFAALPARFESFRSEVSEDLKELELCAPEDRRQVLYEKALSAGIRGTNIYLERGCSSLCFELYFKCYDEDLGTALVDKLAARPGYVVDLLTLGGVSESSTWLHCWFDLEVSEIDQVRKTLEELRGSGEKFLAELESVFVSPTEESLPFDELLLSLGNEREAQMKETATLSQKETPTSSYDLAGEDLLGYIEQALEEDPYNIGLRGQLAHSLAKLSQQEDAAEILEELQEDLEDGGEESMTYWNVAKTYAILEDAISACRHLQTAFDLNPSLKEEAFSEPDLMKLRGFKDFDELLFQA